MLKNDMAMRQNLGPRTVLQVIAGKAGCLFLQSALETSQVIGDP